MGQESRAIAGLGVGVVGVGAEVVEPGLVATPVGQVVLGVGTAAILGYQVYQTLNSDILATDEISVRPNSSGVAKDGKGPTTIQIGRPSGEKIKIRY